MQNLRNSLLESIAILDASIDFAEENESFDTSIVKNSLNNIIKKASETIELSNKNKEILYGTKVLIFGPQTQGNLLFLTFYQEMKEPLHLIKQEPLLIRTQMCWKFLE